MFHIYDRGFDEESEKDSGMGLKGNDVDLYAHCGSGRSDSGNIVAEIKYRTFYSSFAQGPQRL